MVSIHPPRVGRDALHSSFGFSSWGFNPPSPCGEGPGETVAVTAQARVSIHPPRVGRDTPSLC